jgi:hypothetical protein
MMRNYVVFKGKVRKQIPIPKNNFDKALKSKIEKRRSEILSRTKQCKKVYSKYKEFCSHGYVEEYEEDDENDN